MGVIMALFLPLDSNTAKNLLEFFTEISVRMGRYFLLPTIFFSMGVAIARLRIKKTLFRTGGLIVLTGVFSTLVVVLLGVFSAFIIDIPRIPILDESTPNPNLLTIQEHFLLLFPVNGIGGLLDGENLTPLYVLAIFLGFGFAADQMHAKPVFTFFDSASRICYSVLCLFVDFLAIGMIAISCSWFISFFDTLNREVYTGLIILLAGNAVVIICGVLPLLLWLFAKKTQPYKVLYASIAPIITGLFSGDANLSLGTSIRHTKDSLGVSRKIGALSVPLFSSFARSGSGLVVAVSFITILRSYSGLEISFENITWIFFFSVGISFFLSSIPVGGPFIALAFLCAVYGRGFEAGYLLLQPIAFILCTFATVIDVAVSIFGSYFVAFKEKQVAEKNIYKFI